MESPFSMLGICHLVMNVFVQSSLPVMKSVGDEEVIPGWAQHTLDIFCPTKSTVMFSILHLNLSASLSSDKIEGTR